MTGTEAGSGGAVAALEEGAIRDVNGRGLRAPLAALGGVGGAVVVAIVVGARPAAFVLAGVLAAAAATRGLARGDGPAGVAVRSRAFDVAVLMVLAVGIAVLAATAPDL